MLIYFSDIHGNLGAFKKFLKEIDEVDNKIVIFGGDVVGYYYHANEILDVIRQRGFISVLGNHDQYLLDLIDGKVSEELLVGKYGSSYRNIQNEISATNVKYLRTLPRFLHLNVDGKKIAVLHGSPNDHLNGRIYPDTDLNTFKSYFEKFDVVLLGHSHHKMLKKLGNTYIVNAGSLGQQRDGKGCSYINIDLKKLSFNFNVVDYNVSELCDLVKIKDPTKLNNLEVLTRKSKV